MNDNKEMVKDELSDKIKETVIEFIKEQDLEDTEGAGFTLTNVELTF